MNQKKQTAIRRLISLLMTLVMIFSLVPAGIGERLGLTKKVKAAAASVPAGINDEIVKAGVSRLGSGYYLGASKDPGVTVYDCTSLLYACLRDAGFYNIPEYSGGWIDEIVNQNLNITYNGSTLQYVYCDNLTQFRAAVDSSANAGKVIVLKNATDHNSIAASGLLQKGALEIYEGHGALIVGDITPSGVYTSASATDFQKMYSMYKYGKQAYDYLAENYTLPDKQMFQVENTTTEQLQAVINAGAGSLGTYTLSDGMFIQVGGQTDTKHNIWAYDPDHGLFQTAQDDWCVLQVFQQLNLHAYGDSTTWKIEALSPRYGVSYTNNATGKSASETAAYVVYFNAPEGYYYGLDAQKFTTDGTLNFAGPNGANGTYKNTSVGSVGLGGGKAVFSVYKNIYSTGTLYNAVVTNKVIDTPRGGDNGITGNPGGPDNLFSGYFTENAEEVFYIKEETSDYGKPAPGVWKMTMSGAGDALGRGSEIVSVVYYATNADCAGNRGGTIVLDEAGHSGAWYSDGRTAFYETSAARTGTSGAPQFATFEVVNQMYHYSLNLLKWDNQGNTVSGASTPAKFRIGTTIGGSQIAGEVTVNSASAVTGIDDYVSKSGTATFYIEETQAASGTEKREGYWKVEMAGGVSGAASTITGITYFPDASQTTGGIALGTAKTSDAQGWITDKSSTSAIAVLNLVNNRYYLNLGMYKNPTFSRTNKEAVFVLTDSRDTAFAIAAGTSASNGMASVTTGAGQSWFFSLAYGLTSRDALTLYVAEKAAPAQMEKNTGVYEVNITPGVRADGHDSHINWVKYYATSSSEGEALEETTRTGVYGRFGHSAGGSSDVYLVATDTTSHSVTKNGTAVDDGTIISVTVLLQYSDGTTVTTKADGTAITNPVTLDTDGWTYTWTGLDSSRTYKTVETEVLYLEDGLQKTAGERENEARKKEENKGREEQNARSYEEY